MKKIKKIAGRGLEIFIIILVLAVWLYSGFKILNYLKLNEILGKSIPVAGAFLGEPPEPPLPPEPPCPPPCPPSCPTPTLTPSAPTPTPVPIEPTPTPTYALTPTPTPTGVVPTSPPGVGGPPSEVAKSAACGAQVPSTPELLSVQSLSPTMVSLNWTAVDPTTHYAVLYGLSSGNYIYGVADTGKTTSFTVGGLDSAAKYCFAVRAVNGCAPSGLSNEICQGAVGGGRVLGASTLGATGSFKEQLFLLSFIMGCVCLSVGLRFFFLYPAAPGVAKELA